jgi:hypothetical protein
MEDGPDTQLTDDDYAASSRRLGIRQSSIRAFAEVEANGAGFFDGKPKILFEPHVFSRLTKHVFDDSHPTVSYSAGAPVPTRRRRTAAMLSCSRRSGSTPWAAFCAASLRQVPDPRRELRRCGYDSPWAFAFSQAYDEAAQLKAFEAFLRSHRDRQAAARFDVGRGREAYNGPAYLEEPLRREARPMAARAWAQRLGE